MNNLTTFLILLTSGSGQTPAPTNPLGVTYLDGPVASTAGVTGAVNTSGVTGTVHWPPGSGS
jgi:hypothetical protein